MNKINTEEFDSRASKTNYGHVNAIKKWDEFTKSQFPPLKPFKYLQVEDVCGKVLPNGTQENANNPPICKLMAQFTKWIFDYKKEDGNHLKPDVTVRTLSQFKMSLFKKFKPLGYQSDRPDWYVIQCTRYTCTYKFRMYGTLTFCMYISVSTM